MWKKVRQVTGKSKSNASSEQLALFSAERLNGHFSMQSTDAVYTQSNPKLTVLHANDYSICSELNVFYMLSSLKSTSPGTDMLPYWFLKLLASHIAKPVAYLFNLSLITMTVP